MANTAITSTKLVLSSAKVIFSAFIAAKKFISMANPPALGAMEKNAATGVVTPS